MQMKKSMQKLNAQGFTWFGDVPTSTGEIELPLSFEKSRVQSFLGVFLSPPL